MLHGEAKIKIPFLPLSLRPIGHARAAQPGPRQPRRAQNGEQEHARSPLLHPLRRLAAPLLATTLAFTVGAAQAAEELHLYNWGDYINPEVLKRFTDETGIKVSLDTYGSNEEMLAKLQAGATGYDIVFPSVHMHDTLSALGLLEKTDIGASPAFANIDPAFLRAKSDPRGEQCLPYAWGTVGIFYNKTKVDRPSNPGRISSPWPNPAIRSSCSTTCARPWASA